MSADRLMPPPPEFSQFLSAFVQGAEQLWGPTMQDWIRAGFTFVDPARLPFLKRYIGALVSDVGENEDLVAIYAAADPVWPLSDPKAILSILSDTLDVMDSEGI